MGESTPFFCLCILAASWEGAFTHNIYIYIFTKQPVPAFFTLSLESSFVFSKVLQEISGAFRDIEEKQKKRAGLSPMYTTSMSTESEKVLPSSLVATTVML